MRATFVKATRDIINHLGDPYTLVSPDALSTEDITAIIDSPEEVIAMGLSGGRIDGRPDFKSDVLVLCAKEEDKAKIIGGWSVDKLGQTFVITDEITDDEDGEIVATLSPRSGGGGDDWR